MCDQTVGRKVKGVPGDTVSVGCGHLAEVVIEWRPDNAQSALLRRRAARCGRHWLKDDPATKVYRL